jgi:hypothetical protein
MMICWPACALLECIVQKARRKSLIFSSLVLSVITVLKGFPRPLLVQLGLTSPTQAERLMQSVSCVLQATIAKKAVLLLPGLAQLDIIVQKVLQPARLKLVLSILIWAKRVASVLIHV